MTGGGARWQAVFEMTEGGVGMIECLTRKLLWWWDFKTSMTNTIEN